ncbi:ABC transporter ATP-binding protein [Erwinia sp. ErVv1]|uniref:iron ABC transporter ATP-binding protein n=1 Tax=Erwinia sp. ErVv1 TaxID=1603299 RepID=UPI0008340EFE|nr:ATP-binding cassette domain-containing protein [Erwinia sp. ErVv1]
MIEIRDVTKTYQQTRVLKQISETLPEGGITAIIGANGAGKSTLLSVISRLLTPDAGSVSIDGQVVGKKSSSELAKVLSILRQENHPMGRLTVSDLVGFGRYPHSRGRLTAEDRQHIERALAFLNLHPLRDRYLDELSGGQRQRAFVAMVLCQDTKYVLLDEPLNNLDIRHSVAMMNELRRAADELQKTVLLVIHDINFASAYADHIIAMKEGEIIRRGSPQQMMTAENLEAIFDTPVTVERLNGHYVALYYRSMDPARPDVA